MEIGTEEGGFGQRSQADAQREWLTGDGVDGRLRLQPIGVGFQAIKRPPEGGGGRDE
jgi:hypothetical protein